MKFEKAEQSPESRLQTQNFETYSLFNQPINQSFKFQSSVFNQSSLFTLHSGQNFRIRTGAMSSSSSSSSSPPAPAAVPVSDAEKRTCNILAKFLSHGPASSSSSSGAGDGGKDDDRAERWASIRRRVLAEADLADTDTETDTQFIPGSSVLTNSLEKALRHTRSRQRESTNSHRQSTVKDDEERGDQVTREEESQQEDEDKTDEDDANEAVVAPADWQFGNHRDLEGLYQINAEEEEEQRPVL